MKKLKTIATTMSNKNNHNHSNNSNSNDCKPDNYHVNAKICRLVEQYPCMYNRSHVHYLKKDVLDQAWIKIAKEMNDSIASCKERWRNIRTSYARSINVNKIPSSANRTKPYYLHEELKFLSYHITPGIPITRRSIPVKTATVNTSVRASHASNLYNQSPMQNDMESENINVMLHEESFDSYAAALQHSDNESEIQNASNQNTEIYSNENDEKRDDTKTDMHAEIDNCKNVVLPIKTSETLSTTNAAYTMESDYDEDGDDDSDYDEEDEVSENDIDVVESPENNNNNKKSFNYACAPPKKRLQVKDNRSNNNSIDAFAKDVKPTMAWSTSHDYDSIFLQSLLPEMKVMNFHQKILFKKRVFEILTDIFDNHNAVMPTAATELIVSTATTTMSTAMNNVITSSSNTATTSHNNNNNNNNNNNDNKKTNSNCDIRNKRKMNQTTNSLSLSITSPPMVDITDSYMLRNSNNNAFEGFPSPSNSNTTTADSLNMYTPNSRKTPRKILIQKSNINIAEASMPTTATTATTTTSMRNSNKIGARTRSFTNSKRLRLSNFKNSGSSDNKSQQMEQQHQHQQQQQQQQQQQLQTIKQELDTSDNCDANQI